MHLPAPFRAAVGLVATAADEVKHLPDRAVELPMLAVSTALQMSLRAQQRYARLAARGDEVLRRERVGAEPPEWATFDEPVSTDELRRAAMAQLDSLSAGNGSSRFFDELFGVDDPARPAGTPPGGSTHPSAYVQGATGGTAEHAADDGPGATVTPISQAPTAEARAEDAARAADDAPATTTRTSSRTLAKTSAAKSTAAKSTAAKSTAARKAPAKKAATRPAAEKAASPTTGKTVNKPRHTAPSKFDDAADD